MLVKDVIFCDLVNYKKPSMLIEFPVCKDFKCDKECGKQVCQNAAMALEPSIPVLAQDLVKQYMEDDMCQAIVCQGLEPFDSWTDLYFFIQLLRKQTNDDIVIYTGYTEEEISNRVYLLDLFPNIIIKYGRYIPNQKPHYDEILGVNLASDNQYAKKIS